MKLKISVEVSGPALVAGLTSAASTALVGYLNQVGHHTATTPVVMTLTTAAGSVSWIAAKRRGR